MPYLRMFDPERGSAEFDLDRPRVVIGNRPVGCDIRLDHPDVARVHALLVAERGRHKLEDVSTRGSTLVNGEPVLEHWLEHGDLIQILEYAFEYRTDDEERRKRLTRPEDSELDRHLRMEFRMPPKGVRIRYREIQADPTLIFATGDTLRVGGGGILVLSRDPFAACTCLEVEISSPNRPGRSFLGEVVGVIAAEHMPAMCIKLHQLDADACQRILRSARRGGWLAPYGC